MIQGEGGTRRGWGKRGNGMGGKERANERGREGEREERRVGGWVGGRI